MEQIQENPTLTNWNVDNIQYESSLSSNLSALDIIHFETAHQDIQFDDELEAQIRKICKKPKIAPHILKAKKSSHLWNYILQTTPTLTYCEQKYGINYNTSIRVNWCIHRRTQFPQCHNEKCKDFILYKIKCLGFFEEYPLFCQNKFLCVNQSKFHREHVKNSLLEHLGVPVPAKSQVVLAKMQQTCLDNYNVANVFQRPDIIARLHTPEKEAKRLETRKATTQKNFGVDWYVQTDEFRQKVGATCGKSREEKEIVSYIESICTHEIVVGSFKIIYPKQLDIYIPALKLAFEFNGTYYHSIEHDPNIDKHILKTKMCEEAGIKLVHIWEDEWIDAKDKCKQTIKAYIAKGIGPLVPSSGLFAVDRAKFSKCYELPSCLLVAESQPTVILRAKKDKQKYRVPNCGKLIYLKIPLLLELKDVPSQYQEVLDQTSS